MNSSAVIYARRSIAQEDGASTGRQVKDLEAHAAALGLTVAGTFVDEGISGYKDVERPAFTDAVAALTNGTASTLLVWKLDRLSRRGMGKVGELLDELETNGGRIVSLHDGIDSSTDGGRLLVSILSEMARAESKAIGLRTKRAKDDMTDQGRWPGGLPPYGHRLVVKSPSPHQKRGREVVDPNGPVGRLIIDADEASHLRAAAQAVIDGESIRGAAELLSNLTGRQWAKTSTAKLLRSPILVGHMSAHDGSAKLNSNGEPVTVVEGPTVLTLDQRRRLLAALDARKVKTTTGKTMPINTGTALLAGLLRCSCGHRMSIDRSSGMYRCQQRGRLGCRVGGVGIDRAETAAVLGALRWLGTADVDDPRLDVVAERWMATTRPEAGRERSEVEAALAEVTDRLSDLADAHFVRGTVPVDIYDRTATKLSERRDELTAQLNELPEPARDLGILLDLAAAADDPDAGPLAEGSPWSALSPPARREVLGVLLSEVKWDGTNLTVEVAS
jgi:site-specific DNA recombinase